MSKTIKADGKVMGIENGKSVIKDAMPKFIIEDDVQIEQSRTRGKWAFLSSLKVGQGFFIAGRDEKSRNETRQAYQAGLKTYGVRLQIAQGVGSVASGHEGQEGYLLRCAELLEN